MSEQNDALIQETIEEHTNHSNGGDDTEPKKSMVNQRYGTHWHFRITEPTEEYLDDLLSRLESKYDAGRIAYFRAYREAGTDAETNHVHIALGYEKSINKSYMQMVLNIRSKGDKCKHYYLNPIYSTSTPKANAEYAAKNGKLLQGRGEVPDVEVRKAGATAAKEANKLKWKTMIDMAKAQQWKELEETFPYEFINQGAKLKAQYFIQKHDFENKQHEDNLWIYGEPGTGKSTIVQALYPKHYKKRADQDWLGYNPDLEPGHLVVQLPDLDVQSFKKLSAQDLKIMCDPQGFNANKKYAGGDIINPNKIIVTSNYTIGECIPTTTQGYGQIKAALSRRFKQIHIDEYLRQNDLKLKSKVELAQLKANNNWDFTKCFEEADKEVIDLTMEDEPEIINLNEIEGEAEFNKKRKLDLLE